MFEWIQFTSPNQDLSLAYMGQYDGGLVALSLIIAIGASYAALLISERVSATHSFLQKLFWVFSSGLALGGGVWSMHFIGMLAFSLPCGVEYDPLVTLASMIPGVLASTFAMWFVSHMGSSKKWLLGSGIIVGAGIGAMHYTGMAAMRLDAVLYYSPNIFALSIVTAVILAVAALYAKCAASTYFKGWQSSLVAAPIMGSAIAGMHYTAMEAAFFIPLEPSNQSIAGYSPQLMAIAICVVMALMISLGVVSSLLGRFVEISTALKEQSEELVLAKEKAEKLARIDPLTGLDNRLSFYEKANEIHKLACRHEHPYAVIMLDIDFFKKINDTYGHHNGDKALIALARTLQATARSTDIIGRIGGEEFVIVLPETAYERASTLAERIRQAISEIVLPIEDYEVTFTASLGISYHNNANESFQKAVEQADEALYQAKKQGRNRVEVFRS
ncbi:diguanylate cyclase [Terasakiella sp. SH-1]|uniref:MHYT domain-containing protein n=1 Tax=Terasakiella sp. SH-1 TaxID=2560057 RepID=UPI00197FA1A7|nr:diguanylate cyclase [Terasakiella sp. SH-1]